MRHYHVSSRVRLGLPSLAGIALILLATATLLSRINEAAVAGILVGVFSVYWGVIHLRLDLNLLAPTLAFLAFWILSSAVAGSLPSQTGEFVADWIENDGRPLFAVLPVFIVATAKFKQIDLAW